MINTKESQTIEFKQIWKDEYLKTICAFANGEGGSLFIGVNDVGEVIGLKDSQKLVETLPNKINNRLALLVDVVLQTKNQLSYITVTIHKTYAPVSFNGKFYKRSGSNTIELNGGNLTNFLLKKYGKTWDEIAVDNFTLDDINLETIRKFKMWSRHKAPFIEQEKELKTLFERLNLYEDGKLKRAAVLLFGKNPQKYFIQAHSKVGKFLSDSELLTSDIIEGNLFEQLENTIEILRTKYLHSYISYDGLNRIETLEYPYEAVREVVINALIHRDYTDTTVLQIRVYNEKIIFTNGATLSPEVPIEKFKEEHISKPFNPLIANVFYKAGFVESWGKGTNNIVADCLKLGLPEPTYKYTQQAVQVIFYKTPQETPQETPLETTKKSTRENIIILLNQNPKYTINDIMSILHKGRDTVKEHIERLKRDGILSRIGSNKSGYWKIVKNGEKK